MIRLTDTYKNWYTNKAVRFEIIKFLRYRESAFLSKDPEQTPKGVRMLRIHSVQHLDLHMEVIPFRLDHPYNLYMSVAKYDDGIPMQNLNFVERKKDDTNREWNKMAENKIFDYPFFIDIDVNSHSQIDEAHFSAIKLHEYFNKNVVPHEVRFSGMGFHFVIPRGKLKYSFNHTDDNNIYKLYKTIVLYLHDEISELVDLTIYDSKRLIKAPYSLAVYENNETYVCLPFLTTEELKAFKLADFKPENWLKKSEKLYKRGTYLFNPEGTLTDFISKNIKHLDL